MNAISRYPVPRLEDLPQDIRERIVAVQEKAGFEALRAHGFSDEDIWDIGAVAGFFALSNRMANLINMRPNEEFYTMGRERR